MIAVNETRTAFINSIILPKNQVIPCDQSRPFQYRTRRKGGSELEVFVTQGESNSPADVAYLGRHVVHDIPASPGGLTVIDVQYSYDMSGTVKVAAKVRLTGQPLSVTVEPLPSDVPDRFLKPPVEEVIHQHVTAYLAFDLSGSMAGAPLAEAKKAAHGFLTNTDLTHCSLGIIGFSDNVATMRKACQSARDVSKAIDSLRVGATGRGNETHPFDEILKLMGKGEGPRFGIVLADGVWEDQPRAVKRAKASKEAGIDIIAIGFGGADQDFLRAIASSDEVSFFTSLGGLVETFCNIAQELTESGGGTAPPPPTGARKKGLLGFLSNR
jgi:molecular chaperone DnaK